MSNIRIYTQPDAIGDFVRITDMGIVHKLKHVLRLNEGDTVHLFDGAGKEYEASIKYLQNDAVTLRLGGVTRQADRPAVTIDLLFPMTKAEKVDLILQKATELGVSDFYPYLAKRGLKVNPSAGKMARWGNIVREAARQSERLWLPALHEPVALDKVVTADYDLKIFADFKGKHLDALSATPKRVLLIVGPEGDFDAVEKEYLESCGFIAVNIGNNILRLETAAIFLTGLTAYYFQTDKG